MTGDVPMPRVLASVRSAVAAPVIDDPHARGDLSDSRRATEPEIEVLDLLRIAHPKAYVRLSMADWATVDRLADALAQARNEGGAA